MDTRVILEVSSSFYLMYETLKNGLLIFFAVLQARLMSNVLDDLVLANRQLRKREMAEPEEHRMLVVSIL